MLQQFLPACAGFDDSLNSPAGLKIALDKSINSIPHWPHQIGTDSSTRTVHKEFRAPMAQMESPAICSENAFAGNTRVATEMTAVLSPDQVETTRTKIFGTLTETRSSNHTPTGDREPAMKEATVKAAFSSKRAVAKGDCTWASDKLNEYEIDRIIGHRYNADDPTLFDVQVLWKSDDLADDSSWEPESNVQEDTPSVLFRYWRTVRGGRSFVVKDPTMWHILNVKKHKYDRITDKIMLHVAWIGSTQCSWEPEEAVAKYAKEHLDEYWAKLGERKSVLSTSAPITSHRRRNRRSKSGITKTVAYYTASRRPLRQDRPCRRL
ncbi:hypothetical protein S40293_10330 [Stachybotrys chartarum IBT 40293]|nr:hypothetical protein S40293_10330 [Stachybotrys chartarum IBT 40293]